MTREVLAPLRAGTVGTAEAGGQMTREALAPLWPAASAQQKRGYK